MSSKKILVIVPAYNEEQSIASVIQSIKTEAPFADIVVVNDGSTDNTSQITKEMGVEILDLPFNIGVGGAMQTGFRFAAEKDYDIALQIDGDGQHDPQSIQNIIKPILEDKADIIVGSRFIGVSDYKASVSRKIGMWIFSNILSLILRQKLTDTTSGFRGINKETIQFFAENYPSDYPEVEALVLSHYAEFRIREVPVSMQKRKSGKSTITPFKSVYYMVKVLLAVFIWLLRSKPKRKVKVVET